MYLNANSDPNNDSSNNNNHEKTEKKMKQQTKIAHNRKYKYINSYGKIPRLVEKHIRNLYFARCHSQTVCTACHTIASVSIQLDTYTNNASKASNQIQATWIATSQWKLLSKTWVWYKTIASMTHLFSLYQLVALITTDSADTVYRTS